MKLIKILTIAIILLNICSCEQPGGGSGGLEDKPLTTMEDSVSYAIGVNFGTGMKAQKMDQLDMVIVAKAMQDCFDDADLKIGEEASTELLNTFFTKLQNEIRDQNLVKSKDFLEDNKAKEGVQVTSSGLQYIVLEEGDGEKPGAEAKVKVHYEGKLLDGTVFDSSIERGQPVEFEANKVIPGWTEALQLMNVGSKYRLFIPPFLAYGERGSPPNIGPQELLIFEVELLDIVE